MQAERHGIPAVAVVTERFERSVRVVAQVNGLPDYPFVVVGHPIANDSDAALRAKAEGSIDRIAALLTTRDRS